jgi:hypothetical protein
MPVNADDVYRWNVGNPALQWPVQIQSRQRSGFGDEIRSDEAGSESNRAF